ncbi:metal-sensitive transcriptional regulator [soil metagenome]
MMKIQSTAIKENLKQRLARIEGQARGVQKMVEEDRDCQEILQQMNAILAATQNATETFMRAYAKDCLLRVDETDAAAREKLVDNLLDLMAKIR